MISLTLPYPPLANDYRGIRVILKDRKHIPCFYLRAPALAYHRSVRAILIAAGISEPLRGRVAISMRVFRPRAAGDIDGVQKVLLDSMQERVYVKDSQIRRLTIELDDSDKKNPRVEIEIKEIA